MLPSLPTSMKYSDPEKTRTRAIETCSNKDSPVKSNAYKWGLQMFGLVLVQF